MPPPDKPCPFVFAGLPSDEIADIDPDYVYHLRLPSYGVKIPSKSKDGSSRPQVVRFEKPLAGTNAEPPAVGSDGGTRDAPSPIEVKEEDSSAAVEVPSGAASPPVGPNGKARRCAVPVEGDGLLSHKRKPAWYDSVPNIDKEYRFFLQHARVVNDSDWVFEVGNFRFTHGEASSVRDCEDDDEDEDEEDEDEEDEEDGSGEVEDVSASDDNSVKTEEENSVQEEKSVVVGSKWPIVKVEMEPVKMGEDVEDSVKTEEDEMDSDKNEWMDAARSDLQLGKVNSMEIEELQGVIWPTHIIERPESDFKRKLMKVLMKPFNREECDELFAKATDRTPIIKERRTRRRVMYYPWKHEMGKSYFDVYADLAAQVEGERSYPIRLALLRGFFFWLENVGHDEQFRPWSADHKRYRLTLLGS